MQPSSLPDDIWIIMLRELLSPSSNRKDAFRANLLLLSVCRQWRQLALPMVYKYAFIQCASRMESSCIYGSRFDLGNDDEDTVAISTNLGLLAAAGYVNAVKTVELEVRPLVAPFLELSAAIRTMGIAAETWNSVRALELNVRMGSHRFEAQSIKVADYEGVIARVCDSLAAMVPNACELRFVRENSNHCAHAIYGRLAWHYAGQLEVLASDQPIDVPHGRPFIQLKHVALRGYSDNGLRLPLMNPESIEHLELDGFLANHSWCAFHDGSKNNVAVLPKLQSLCVNYNEDRRDRRIDPSRLHRQQWALQFPALKDLSVICAGNMCPLLENAVLPNMDSVTVSANTSLYQSIAGITMTATKCLTLRITGPSDDDATTPAAACDILARAGRCSEKVLIIGKCGMWLQPEHVTCTDLTRLVVSAPASVDTMLSIICRCSHLTCVKFKNLMQGTMQSDISIPASKEHEPVTPLSTTITSLDLYLTGYRKLKEAAPLVKYVLLKIPTLTSFLVTQIGKRPILGFVDEYSQWYPHLANVKLKFSR